MSGEEGQTEKMCWQCGRTFETTMEVCPDDGAQLIETDVEDRDDPLVGTVFDDRFRIYRKLGEGGMGAVYSARRLDFETDVALKLLKVDFTNNEEIRKRFMYEARVISNLKHPHAIQVFDFGQTDEGHVYMVMELLEGESLADRLGYRFLSYREVFDIIPPICGVLGEAHTRDVVHRDLKPENIYLLDVDGNEEFPKLLDFGIAKHHRAETMTKSGTLWGTPAYMSPEQARGSSVGAAADIYGIGIMLFELITGNLPFSASTQMGHAVKHLKAPVRAPSTIPGLESLPDELDEYIVGMLAKDPDERPDSMDAVAESLDQIREEHFDEQLLDSVPAKEVDPIRLQQWIDEAPDVSGELPAEDPSAPESAPGGTSPVEVLDESGGFEVVDEDAESPDQARELQETAVQPSADSGEVDSREPRIPDGQVAETARASSDKLQELADAETRMLQAPDEADGQTPGDSGLAVDPNILRGAAVVFILAVAAAAITATQLGDDVDPADDELTTIEAADGDETGPSGEDIDRAVAAQAAVRSAASLGSRVRFETFGIIEAIDPEDLDEDLQDQEFDFLHGTPPSEVEEGTDEEVDEDQLREALEETF